MPAPVATRVINFHSYPFPLSAVRLLDGLDGMEMASVDVLAFLQCYFNPSPGANEA